MKCASLGLFVNRYLTLDIWRWGIQGIICAILTSLLVVIPQLNSLFHGAGYWAVSSAVVVLEGTTGGSVKKCLERLAGTLIGGVSGLALFSLVTWNERWVHTVYCRIGLWIIVCLFPMPWGYIRVKFPLNPLIAVYGVMTGYIVMISAYLKGDPINVAMLRIVAVGTGVFVASVVVHLVFPRRARVEIKKGLADVLLSIANILEPLLEISAGLTPLETLNVLQPVKDKLKDIAMKRYELHEKRDRHHKQKHDGNQLPNKELASIQSVPPYDVSVVDEPEVERFAPIESIVRKLSISLTGLLRRDTTNKDIGNDTEKGDEAENPFDLQESRSQLPTLLFRNEPTTSISIPEGVPIGGPLLQSAEQSNEPRTTEDTSRVTGRPLRRGTPSCEGTGLRRLSEQPLGDVSGVSSASAFYRDQSLQLDILRAKTLKDVTLELTRSLEMEEKQRHARWGKTMEQFEKCQRLLSTQSALLIEAKQEISIRGPTVFPSEKYRAALTHIQALFHHTASLFFSLDLQLAHVARVRGESCTSPHKAGQKHSLVTFAPFDDLHVSDDPNIQKQIYAGMTAALENTEVFGHIIAEAVVNIRDALRGLANSVLTGESIEDPLASIDAASRAITVLNDLRRQRSQIISKIFTTAMIAESEGKGKTSSKGGTQNLPWEMLMGVEPHVFQDMTRQEHEAYWSNFWRARDRLSVTNGTLMLLRDQLYVLCEVIAAIVQKEHEEN